MFSLRRPPLLLRSRIRFSTSAIKLASQKYRRFGDPIKSPFPPSSVPSAPVGRSTGMQGIRLPFDKSRFDRFRKNPPILILVLGTGGIVYYVTHLERVPSRYVKSYWISLASRGKLIGFSNQWEIKVYGRFYRNRERTRF